MGKQKKGSAAKSNNKKKERKEQKKERRTQANAQAKIDASLDEVERIFQELHLENSLLVGRLYYYLPDYPYDQKDVNSYRGILKQVVGDENDDNNGKAVFQSIFPFGDSEDHRVTVPLRNVIRQRVAWTLRYGVGDLVVVYDDYNEAFTEAKIEHVWPVWESPKKAFGKNRTANLVLYLCRTMDRAQRAIKVSEDEDYYIQRLPTSFRFSPGDRVVVSTTRALFPRDDRRIGNELWEMGTVKDTHVSNQSEYAYYECELDNSTGGRGRGSTCYILGDSVAFIFSASASPRETLFAAIGDPAFKRKDFSSFVERYGIDVSIFFDLFVAKAVEYASYGALSWLNRDKKMKIETVRDSDGNGLFHQLAQSPYLDHFLKSASQYNHLESGDGDSIHLALIILEMNPGGQWWADFLVRDRSLPFRTLELALSPDFGLGLVMSAVYYSTATLAIHRQLKLLQDEALNSRRFNVAKMIEHLLFTFPVYAALQIIRYTPERVENDIESGVLLERFNGGTIVDFSKWFVYVMSEKCGRIGYDQWAYNFCVMARDGCFRLVELILDRIPALATISYRMTCNTKDRGDFLQEYDGEWSKDFHCTVPFIDSVAMHRQTNYSRDISSAPHAGQRSTYYVELQRYADMRKGGSLFDYIRKATSSYDDKDHLGGATLLSYRSSLLVDDPTLSNRLMVLEILIKVHGVPPPSPVNLVRWRQCGVLRYLERESMLDLMIPAKSVKSFHTETKLRFVGGRPIPQHMTVGEYLCFACVEFDDLQSLQWLTMERGIHLLTSACNGWNICHAVAVFGRAEFVLWLKEFDGFETLACASSQRKGEEKKLPVHLAIEAGHSFIADRFLGANRDLSEKVLTSVMQIAVAVQSRFRNVQEWVQRREKPLKLSRDVQTLLRLLHELPPAWSKAKTHILTSLCLDVEVWHDCGMWHDDACVVSGPWCINERYTDLLLECIRLIGCATSPLFSVFISSTLRPEFTITDPNSRFGRRSFLSKDCFAPLDEQPLEWGALRLEFQRMHGGQAFEGLISRSQAWHCPALRDQVYDPTLADPIFSFVFKNVQESRSSSELIALAEIRDSLLKLDFLVAVRRRAENWLQKLILRGISRSSVEEVVSVFEESSNLLALERGTDFATINQSWNKVMHDNGVLNASHLIHTKYNSSKFRGMLMLNEKRSEDSFPLYMVLAIEDYVHLATWLLLRPTNLTCHQELDMTRVAAFFGAQQTIDVLLSLRMEVSLRSSRSQRIHAAILGAAEAGKLSALEDLYALGGRSLPPDEFVMEATGGKQANEEMGEEDSNDSDEGASRFLESVTVCAIHGYLASSESASADHERVCCWLAAHGSADSSIMLCAASSILTRSYNDQMWERLLSLYRFLQTELLFDPIESFEHVECISQALCRRIDWWSDRDLPLRAVALNWVSLLVDSGVDVQHFKLDKRGSAEDDREFVAQFEELRMQQLRSWACFDVVKNAHTLPEIQRAVARDPSLLKLRDRGGLSLTHLAAVYDRVDVVEWLVEEMGQDLAKVENEGRDVIAVAKASGSASVAAWIELRRAKQVISLFFSRQVRRHTARRRRLLLISSITKLQAWTRGTLVKRKYGIHLVSRLEESSSFRLIWSAALGNLLASERLGDSVWSLVREDHGKMTRSEGTDLGSRLEDALREAMNDGNDYAESEECDRLEVDFDIEGSSRNGDSDGDNDNEYRSFSYFEATLPNPNRFKNQVLLTNDVLKWCRTFDLKYVGFFIRRMEQLASGERSRILAKRLKGCLRIAVFETYLEQKSGHRILWTVQASGEVLVWFVVKHKEVSRYANLIDSSVGRTNRQLSDAMSTLGVVSRECELCDPVAEIVLDPLGNTPLKLYTVTKDHVQRLANASWTPPLRLTPEERVIVEASGTTLVLGRSGTGKTICLCNKIDFDRHWNEMDESFSQLFVARSERLSRFVRRTVGDPKCCAFSTFHELLSTLESSLSSSSASSVFLPSQKVDYALFKRDVYRSPKLWGGVDALVIWTNIRSFIKGSIDALTSPGRILAYDDYVSVVKLGRKRCRLSPDHRPEVYKAFKAYSKYLVDTGRWDDCDRISCLLQCLQATKDSDTGRFERLRYSKIYVDEVQDYTQAEILLFFYLSRPRDLFLCGDPAQSVVEGVEFRFEEIRSVAHFVAGADRRHLVPQKPLTVNVNFRSHSGILNVAAAVLSRLFAIFPDSAKQLKEDRGLFVGPRPGVLYKADMQLMNSALTSVLAGSTVLIHDDHKMRCSQALGDYRLMYGIREAKGLEFKSVIIFDFFAGIPKPLQKPWRDLLLGRKDLDYASKFPEVEGQLKLLYTAITRSIDRLLFVESKPSIAGEAFCRWSTTTTTRATSREDEPLAVRQRVSDVESLQMSVDEWVLAGLENAEAAEGSPDPETAGSFLVKALHCFEQANDANLAAKARAHRSGVLFRSQFGQEIAQNRKYETTVEMEMSVAQLLSQLFREGLWTEAAKVCHLVLRHLPEYTQDQLRIQVLPKLPSV